jgi:hypothetical protein
MSDDDIWYFFAMHHASAPSTLDPTHGKVGPPYPDEPSPGSGATDRSLRPTVIERPTITPRVLPGTAHGFAVTHPYVRRFWIPILGPGAVADLCRLATAAQRGRPLRRPVHLVELAHRGLVVFGARGEVSVAATVRPLTRQEILRLPPHLRIEHQAEVAKRSPAIDHPSSLRGCPSRSCPQMST